MSTTGGRVPRHVPDEHCRSRYIVRARFCDTDLMGIVHHAKYLEYFEAGRVEYMHRRGLDYLAWTDHGIHFPVVEAQLRYKKPVRFDERVAIDTVLTELTRVTVRFTFRVVRAAPAEELVAEGYTLLACVGENHAPRRIPPEMAELLVRPETHPRPIDQV